MQSVFILSIYTIKLLNNTYIIVNRNVHKINTNINVLIINVNEIEDDRMSLKSKVFVSCHLNGQIVSNSTQIIETKGVVVAYVWKRTRIRRLHLSAACLGAGNVDFHFILFLDELSNEFKH